jgi:hypothetical protein
MMGSVRDLDSDTADNPHSTFFQFGYVETNFRF